jgi:hypothetical protein
LWRLTLTSWPQHWLLQRTNAPLFPSELDEISGGHVFHETMLRYGPGLEGAIFSMFDAIYNFKPFNFVLLAMRRLCSQIG